MKIRLIAALALIAWASLIDGCANWQPRDKALFATTVSCHAVDAEETIKATREGYGEANPIYGKHPSIPLVLAIKAAVLGVLYWSADQNDHDRTTVLSVATGLCGGFLIWNGVQGVHP